MKSFSPLIIGEWTATDAQHADVPTLGDFQSPNHRGVDCNDHCLAAAYRGECPFQSPNHRGVDCNSKGEIVVNTHNEHNLSVP